MELITLPKLKLYYKAIVIKIVQYWNKNQILKPMIQNSEPKDKAPYVQELIYGE